MRFDQEKSNLFFERVKKRRLFKRGITFMKQTYYTRITY